MAGGGKGGPPGGGFRSSMGQSTSGSIPGSINAMLNSPIAVNDGQRLPPEFAGNLPPPDQPQVQKVVEQTYYILTTFFCYGYFCHLWFLTLIKLNSKWLYVGRNGIKT